MQQHIGRALQKYCEGEATILLAKGVYLWLRDYPTEESWNIAVAYRATILLAKGGHPWLRDILKAEP